MAWKEAVGVGVVWVTRKGHRGKDSNDRGSDLGRETGFRSEWAGKACGSQPEAGHPRHIKFLQGVTSVEHFQTIKFRILKSLYNLS